MPAGLRVSKESPDQEVVGLREVGLNRIFPLRSTEAIESSGADLRLGGERAELCWDGRHWSMRVLTGALTCNGVPAQHVQLSVDAELAFAGRRLVVESKRTLALHDFLGRILGWHTPAVENARRALRSARSGQAMLVLHGSAEMARCALALHRRMLGAEAPFVVVDPKKRRALPGLRDVQTADSATTGISKARNGTLCLRVAHLPADFERISGAFRDPPSPAIVLCARDGVPLRIQNTTWGRIDVPDVSQRAHEIEHVIDEYVQESANFLSVSRDCLLPEDMLWLRRLPTRVRGFSIVDYEAATLRILALRYCGSAPRAARMVGMHRFAFTRWFKHRHYATQTILGTGTATPTALSFPHRAGTAPCRRDIETGSETR